MLAGGLIRKFGELADQLLENQPHLDVVDLAGVHVDAREPLRDQIEQLVLVKPLDRPAELEVLKDGTHIRREALDVAVEVGADIVLVAHELAHVERRDVVEVETGLALDEGLEGDLGRLLGGELLEGGLFGWGEHAVQAAQDREREDHATVLALLEVTPQEVGDGPDQGGKGLLVHIVLNRNRSKRSSGL